MLPFSTIQRQRCIKILCPKDPEFYTPLVLNPGKGQHLSALEVYKNQSPIKISAQNNFWGNSCRNNFVSEGKHKLFGPVSLGTALGFETVEAQFVPGKRSLFLGLTGVEGWQKNYVLKSETGRPSCRGTQFDKITTRYEYWEVLSPPSVYFNREFVFFFLSSLSYLAGSATIGSTSSEYMFMCLLRSL